jgi:ectoine hydroxylase-related dioxygenase (phytanoyl-CoA dioxygenase family)
VDDAVRVHFGDVNMALPDAPAQNALSSLRDDGYVVLRDILSIDEIGEIRTALAPHLGRRALGRNNFEGHETERVYSLVAKGAPFERLVEHPRILELCDALLEPGYLLTASQAICIHPGETPQPFHTDDSFYRIARPRDAVSISTIFAIDPFTSENGATQIVPRSHAWGDEKVGRVLSHLAAEFATAPKGARTPRPARPASETIGDAAFVDVTMPAGSVVVFLGTLVHRGGENESTAPRLALSNQYCAPWARQQENFLLSVPREQARAMSARVQALLGYSIHPPFMGHVAGLHPAKLLRD